ncbi:hypothetical protein [Tomitella biformata]|uniref:hypothetical protein n=1 Tax=Tomitella biformata TaxID=630403 RepID=UPI0004649037|nr:hypothetical protein [Tomitella biformata]
MKSFVAKVSPAQWAGLIIAILAVVFVLMNTASMKIKLFGLDLTGPQWFILLIVFVVGWLVGVLTSRRRNKKSE